MKLITELNEDVEYLSEAKESGEKIHYIVGRFITCDQENKNGRIYESYIVDPEINRYTKEVIKENRAFGELGHPNGPTVNLDRVSHIITELKKDGKYYVGKARLTETPCGQIAIGLIKSGGKLGVSTRGLGSLIEKNGSKYVQKDFKLSTVDIVSDPSGPGCFVQGIMENAEWIYDPVKGTWHEEKISNIKNSIKNMSLREIEEKQLAIFEHYITSLTINNNKI
jgi:hypothetical protein